MRLAADANVLLSAVIGGRAGLVFGRPEISEIVTTEQTFAELEEYVPVLGRSKGLPADVLLLAVAALPVTVVNRDVYAKSLPKALRLIGHRDADDAELLALALHFEIPLWSNDKDFKDTDVALFTTEHLLRRLGIIE
ncbi:MAG: PIN domain-containing protein [Candidatus Sulfotelmatobacter sp.]